MVHSPGSERLAEGHAAVALAPPAPSLHLPNTSSCVLRTPVVPVPARVPARPRISACTWKAAAQPSPARTSGSQGPASCCRRGPGHSRPRRPETLPRGGVAALSFPGPHVPTWRATGHLPRPSEQRVDSSTGSRASLRPLRGPGPCLSPQMGNHLGLYSFDTDCWAYGRTD